MHLKTWSELSSITTTMGGGVPAEGREVRQRDHDRPERDQVQYQREPCIAAAAQDPGVRRHLIGHREQYHALNQEKRVCQIPRLVGDAVDAQQRDAQEKQHDPEGGPEPYEQQLHRIDHRAQLLSAAADLFADHDRRGRTRAHRRDLEQQKRRRGDGIGLRRHSPSYARGWQSGWRSARPTSPPAARSAPTCGNNPRAAPDPTGRAPPRAAAACGHGRTHRRTRCRIPAPAPPACRSPRPPRRAPARRSGRRSGYN